MVTKTADPEWCLCSPLTVGLEGKDVPPVTPQLSLSHITQDTCWLVVVSQETKQRVGDACCYGNLVIHLLFDIKLSPSWPCCLVSAAVWPGKVTLLFTSVNGKHRSGETLRTNSIPNRTKWEGNVGHHEIIISVVSNGLSKHLRLRSHVSNFRPYL